MVDEPINITSTFHQAVDGYLFYARAGLGLSKNTLKSYSNRLRKFEWWLEHGSLAEDMPRWNQHTGEPEGASSTVPLTIFTVETLERYRTELEIKKLRPRTKLGLFQPLRSLGDYLVKRGVLPHNPAHEIDLPKKDAPDRVLTSNRDARATLDACQRLYTQREQLRASAIVAVMVFAALRRHELLDLRVGDIRLDDSGPELIVRRGKGEKRRELFIHQECKDHLALWLQERATMGCKHDYLFAYNAGRRLGKSGLSTLLRRLENIAGVPIQTVQPHSIRRNTASRLLENGADLKDVQEFLGHGSITTTAAYLFGNAARMRMAGQRAGFAETGKRCEIEKPTPPPKEPETQQKLTIRSFTRLRRRGNR